MNHQTLWGKLALVAALCSLPSFAAKPSANLSGEELKLLGKLAQGNISEVETGKFVKGRAQAESVRAFATRMIDDHAKMSQKLKDWAGKNQVQLPNTPNNSPDEGKKLVEDLTKLSGKEFDQHYIGAMLEDHNKDVAEVAEFLGEHPASNLKPVLNQVLPILENHLRVAEHVAGELGVPADKGLNRPEHPQ